MNVFITVFDISNQSQSIKNHVGTVCDCRFFRWDHLKFSSVSAKAAESQIQIIWYTVWLKSKVGETTGVAVAEFKATL